MGSLVNPNNLVDGATITDATAVGPQNAIRDFTNGNIGGENFAADAGIQPFRLASPVTQFIVAGSIPTLAAANTRVLLHLTSPTKFHGAPSEIKINQLAAYVGENVGGTALLTISARLHSTRTDLWYGPDGSTGDWQTLWTNPLSLTWNTYSAVRPKISPEFYDTLQMRVNITGGTIRGLAVYAICEGARLP